MSHFEDVEPLFWGDGPKTPLGCAFFGVVAVIAIVWACWADDKAADVCKQHGEAYVDSKSAYTLCRKPDGTVVQR
jgi:hypothetical protein